MDVFDIRLANLKRLTQGLTTQGKLKKDVATALNLSPSHFSQLLAGKRMGEDVARKIEEAAGLERGAMDQADTYAVQMTLRQERAPYRSHEMRIDPTIIAEAIRLVRLAFQFLDSTHDNEADGVPVALAYEFLASRSEHRVTPDNLVEFSKALSIRRERERAENEVGSASGTGAGDRLTGSW